MPNRFLRPAAAPIVMFCLLLLAACAPRPVAIPPESPDSAALGLEVEISPPLPVPPFPNAEGAFFVRLEPGQSLLEATTIIESNYFWDGRAYLLNAAPGEYAAVATYHYPEGVTVGGGGATATFRPRHVTFFPQAMVEATRGSVAAGDLAYLGNVVVDQPNFGGLGDADAMQKHFGELIEALVQGEGGFNTVENTAAARSAFMAAAKADFAETDWAGRVR